MAKKMNMAKNLVFVNAAALRPCNNIRQFCDAVPKNIRLPRKNPEIVVIVGCTAAGKSAVV